MEHRVQQLEEDLKNARHMISCLNKSVEMLTRVKNRRDDEILQKLNEIVEQQKNKCDLERKVDYLIGELDMSKEYIPHVFEKLEYLESSLKSLEQTTDTVQTIEGYTELFVKDFDSIHISNKQLEEKLERCRFEAQNAVEKANVSETRLSNAVDNLHKKIDKLNDPEIIKISQQCDNLAKVTANVDRRVVIESEKVLKLLDASKRELRTEISIVNEKVGVLTGPIYKCWGCKNILPNEYKLRQDGVSILCPSTGCNSAIIVETLKRGYKWTTITPEGESKWCRHFNQVPIDANNEEGIACQFCGKIGRMKDNPSTPLCI